MYKFGTPEPRQSPLRDMEMAQEIRFLEKLHAIDRPNVPLVIEGEIPKRLVALLIAARKPYWWSDTVDGLLVPASWRHVTAQMKMAYWQRALERQGSCQALTIRMSHRIAKAAGDANPSFIDYMRRRVAKHLRWALGRTVEFWFTVEVDQKGTPHIHGAVGIKAGEIGAARNALIKAGGDWAASDSTKVTFKRVYDGVGWARYSTKRYWRKYEIKGNFGRGYTGSRGINAKARQLYEDHKRLVLKLRDWRARHPLNKPRRT